MLHPLQQKSKMAASGHLESYQRKKWLASFNMVFSIISPGFILPMEGQRQLITLPP